MEFVQHLLQADSQVNHPSLAGLTLLSTCPELMRMMLDWGADAQAGDRSMGSNRSYSLATRSFTNKLINGGWDRLNQSEVDKDYKLKQTKRLIL